MRIELYRSKNFILKHENYEFCKIPRNSSNLVRDVINDSESPELLSVFRITQRIQNYSTYSEYSAYSLFTRASRKASPERLTFRPPVGVLSAYHALILVMFQDNMVRYLDRSWDNLEIDSVIMY